MFKAIHHTDAARTFGTYAEAYRFVMREGNDSKLWEIVAATQGLAPECRKERAAFFAGH